MKLGNFYQPKSLGLAIAIFGSFSGGTSAFALGSLSVQILNQRFMLALLQTVLVTELPPIPYMQA